MKRNFPMSKSPRKPRTPAPAGETKSAKFSRLASARVAKAVKTLKAIGNLSGSGYEYTEDQVAAIDGFITDAWKRSKARFSAGGKEEEPEIKI